MGTMKSGMVPLRRNEMKFQKIEVPRLEGGYSGRALVSVRGGKLFVSLCHLQGGRWGSYEVGGFELVYSKWLSPIIPSLKKFLSKKYGARRAASLIKGWKE